MRLTLARGCPGLLISCVVIGLAGCGGEGALTGSDGAAAGGEPDATLADDGAGGPDGAPTGQDATPPAPDGQRGPSDAPAPEHEVLGEDASPDAQQSGDVLEGGDALPSAACQVDADCPTQTCWDATCLEGACAYVANTAECDDQNACTFPDHCAEGVCLAGPIQCDEICDNGVDDDQDGHADCLDTECLDSAVCWATCHGQELLACGQQIFDTTDKWAATGLIGAGCGFSGDGQEVIYRFVPPDGLLTATATLEGQGHVSLFAPGDLGACEGPVCVDAGQTWTWAPDGPEEALYIVVDGPAGGEGPFALTLTCTFPLFESCSNGEDDDGDGDVDCDDTECMEHPICGAPIEDCDNGEDDDLDGATDCDDTNCFESFACSPAPGCDPLYDLPCGVVLTDEIGGQGSTQFIDAWGCAEELLGGPEMAHRIAFDVDTNVHVSLDGAPEGARLLLVADAEACDVDDCALSHPTQLTFVAEAGASYAIVIDAPLNTTGSYTLTVDCVTPELCSNDFDDDQDGLVDCEDAACFGVAPCLGQVCQASQALNCDQTWGGVLPQTGALEESACGPTGAGGEVIAVFTVDQHTDVVFSASGEGSPALFAMDATGVCDTGLCLDGGDPQLALSMEATSSIYLVVDGAEGGAFQVSVNCQGGELFCADSIDDDGDGSTDCADTDCLGSEGCAPSCPVLGTVTCGAFPLATADAGSSVLDGWGCPEAPILDGPEVGWRLDVSGKAQPEVEARVVLYDPDDTGAALLVVSAGMTCDPMACQMIEDAAVELLLGPNDAPYILVDRPEAVGEQGTVGITVNCDGYENACLDGVDGDGDGLQDCADPDCMGQIAPCASVEYGCHNGVDDDGDQLVDCEDDDCAMAINCYVAPVACVQTTDAFCNVPTSFATSATGAQPGPLTFACPGEVVEATQGTLTKVFIGEGEEVTVVLDGVEGAGHAVVIASDDGVDCDPSACVASGSQSFAFEAAQDQTYLVVFMSTDEAPASAAVTVQCELPEADCFDGVDDDEDGLTDCDDPGCAGVVACQVCLPSDELTCDTPVSVDALSLGTTNALDEACGVASPGPERSFYWAPSTNTEALLTSSSGDTRFHVFAGGSPPCQAEACVASGPSPLQLLAAANTTYTIAVDTVSPEGEAEVEIHMACLELQESCDNGVDDDADGLTDCEDMADCKLSDACPMLEVCDDGLDNDDDGFSDCQDVGCVGGPSCVGQEDCGDGIDNDADGTTDCQDTLCAVDPACQPQEE